jgi:hypothetical protein
MPGFDPAPGLLQEARAIKEECEGILAEAIPALSAAIAALDTIKKPDIQLVAVSENDVTHLVDSYSTKVSRCLCRTG